MLLIFTRKQEYLFTIFSTVDRDNIFLVKCSVLASPIEVSLHYAEKNNVQLYEEQEYPGEQTKQNGSTSGLLW